MRKLLRMKMRRYAEQQDGKTIKVFRKSWKDFLKSNGVVPRQRKRKPTKKYLW